MSIMKSEDNFTKDCNPLLSKERVKLWKARDINGSEIEVGKFLYFNCLRMMAEVSKT